MVVADGRVVAWTECGPADGVPVLRMPGMPGCRWTLRAAPPGPSGLFG